MLTLVPRYNGPTSITVLVAAFGQTSRPPTLKLDVTSHCVPVTIDEWRVIDGGSEPPIYWCRRVLDGLSPNSAYELRLRQGADVLAQARFDTPPESLPVGDGGTGPHRPFTLWLSSCFSARQAQTGLGPLVQQLFAHPRLRPHLNCLVGDQVYLDELSWFIYTALSERRLRSRFNRQYTNTFTHPAFSHVMASASNLFLADDHELWNNYPHSPLGFPLRSQQFWRRWLQLAYVERCEPLQAPAKLELISVGRELSICIADLRLERSANALRFTDEASMRALVAWLESLSCPGVLITQQPVISPRGHASDMRLPDYRQYWSDLLPALHRCKQDLVILAGDVHHGHVAHTLLGNAAAPRQLIQVVASPLALINPVAASTPESALRYFPSADGVQAARPVAYPLQVPTYAASRGNVRSEDHAMTVAFWRAPSVNGSHRVGMQVRTWLTRAATTQLGPTWQTTLRAG